MTLRALRDETDPLPVKDLKTRGDELLTEARGAAIEALHKSASTTMLLKSYQIPQIRRFQAEARTAAAAWQKVDRLLSELVNEYERSKGAKMSGDDRLVTVCSSCLQASCWQGEFYCDNYKTAGTTRLTIHRLRSLAREHESYWDAARIARIEGLS